MEPEFADQLGLPLVHGGKIRELYAVDDPAQILMVATDRISAFDHVLTPAVPGKGKILTQLSNWWFGQLTDIVDNHVVSDQVPAAVAGRGVICERLQMIGVECVARGYLTGSGWVEYQQSRTVCGVPLPEGLSDGDRLPEPIFTPAAKAAFGDHDENIDFAAVERMLGAEQAAAIRDLTLQIYTRAAEIAEHRGLLLADTKFEFGVRADGTIVLADEVLTPDSSRFWDAEEWRRARSRGEVPEAFDKQYVRNWLLRESGWDRAGDAAPPALPAEVIETTRRRYADAYQRLTGEPWREADDSATTLSGMTRVVVEVMPKPEILDPQGKAVTGALRRLGFEGLTVRQGKMFEIEIDGELDDARLAQIEDAAQKLLANTVIEDFVVHVAEESVAEEVAGTESGTRTDG